MCANAAEMPTLKSPRTAAHAHIQALAVIVKSNTKTINKQRKRRE